jgi:2-keto-4-pentenoate hydratase
MTASGVAHDGTLKAARQGGLMTDNRKLRRIADRLLRARAGARLMSGETPASGPADRAQAYEVQRLVASRLGPVGAFKTGRRSPDEEPIMAPIPAAMVRASPARFGPGELNLIGLELEVAFLVHRALPGADDPRFAERARACVFPLAAIEIIDSRLADYEAAGALWKLADHQVNGGFVHGAPVGDWDDIDLATLDARLEIDGETVLDGPATVPGGDAFDIFCAFARTVGSHCGGLVPGQYVTTGTLTGVRFIEPGRRVAGHIAGLGSVTVGFPAQ